MTRKDILKEVANGSLTVTEAEKLLLKLTDTQPRSAEYWKGFDYACDILEDAYAKSHPHKYNISDCLKAKVNRLPKSKIRKNNNNTKQLNEEEQERLVAAFSAVCNMFFATEKDNFSKCSSFHIKPFNTHWDKKTVKEVMYGVKLYLSSWVIFPMEQALKMDRCKVKRYEQKRHKSANDWRKEWQKKIKSNN